jgi:transglutaminase-like putative cysteine protease
MLKSDQFDYDTDVRGLCDGISAVECFASFRRGYCLHYASTMAVLLREAKIPARLVEGYLRGERDPVTGVESIKSSAAHAWVEVYFPTFGWYPFDPTGGPGDAPLPGQREPALEPGPSVTPLPSVAPSLGPLGSDDRGPDPLPTARDGRDGAIGSLGGPRDGGNQALLISLAVLLLVVVGAVAFAAWRRGPRGEVTAEGVWRSVGRTAARFGFGPRPQQTVYEYAGVLSDVLPTNRPELETVARAKVEVAYGRRELGDDARRTLRDAQRRLRVGLLRLALRRNQRRRPKR